MIYAMSDIHGQYELFEKRVNQIRPFLENPDSKLILLGDYIDRGRKSYESLKLAYDLEQEFGKDKVIVLKGNHEVWFEEFLFQGEDVWLAEDEQFCTSGTFLTQEELGGVKGLADRETQIDYLKKYIKTRHRKLLSWMQNLRLFYETKTQIFVHAGVDEEIPEEEMEWCTLGTPDYVMTGKFPPTTGHFYKDIIAGHTAASKIAGEKGFRGIFFDGYSHYYIDGQAAKFKRVLCLAYDEKDNTYYELAEDGTLKKVIARKNGARKSARRMNDGDSI